jgi:hypothetical protein
LRKKKKFNIFRKSLLKKLRRTLNDQVKKLNEDVYKLREDEFLLKNKERALKNLGSSIEKLKYGKIDNGNRLGNLLIE